MNRDRFEEFSRAYREGLLEAVLADEAKHGKYNPQVFDDRDYGYGPEGVPIVVDRMMRAIADHPMGVNYGGGGFARAARKLGIKPTRQAILSYLDIKPHAAKSSEPRGHR